MDQDMDLRSSELQQKFMLKRINTVEDGTADLHGKFDVHIKKLAQVRDTSDELANSVNTFASNEAINLGLRSAFIRFADVLVAVEDYRETEITRLDHKVVSELCSYGAICQQAKDELKTSSEARVREQKKQNKLEKVRTKKPTNWQHINQAAYEAEQATDNSTLATMNMSQKMTNFEQKKLENLKKVFLDFATIKILFHSKALELYSKAYDIINEIKIDEELEHFQNRFRNSFTLPNTSLKQEENSKDETHNPAVNVTDNMEIAVPAKDTVKISVPVKPKKSIFSVSNMSKSHNVDLPGATEA